MRDGAQILRDLDDASKGVAAASTELSRLLTKFGEAHVDDDGQLLMGVKLEYEVAIKEELATIHQHAMEDGRRAPGEDIRRALAEKAVRVKDPALFADYHA